MRDKFYFTKDSFAERKRGRDGLVLVIIARVAVRSNSASDYYLFQWFRHLYRRRGTVNAADDVDLTLTLR